MTTKHTPGPWIFNIHRYPNGQFNGRPYIYAPNAVEDPHEGRHIAELCTVKEVDANTRLIAAAPDLLEACLLVYANLKPKYSSSHVCMQKLEAAIAKAQGE